MEGIRRRGIRPEFKWYLYFFPTTKGNKPHIDESLEEKTWNLPKTLEGFIMHNKAAAKRARAINRFLDPSLKCTDGSERLFGKEINPKRRDFHRILMFIERQMRQEDPTLPRTVSLGHYAVMKRLFELANRDNINKIKFKCPECGKAAEAECIDPKLEKNSVTALEVLADRMFPKMATITHEINIYNTILNIGSGMAQIVTEYVSPDKRVDCMVKIRALLASYRQDVSEQNQIPYSPSNI
jgi:transcription elongation factor Elf1